jgi:hypothetical protein
MNAKILPVLLLAYGAASLAHFIHNAEFLPDYPGLPATWNRAGVYGAWLAMTAVGIAGWLLSGSRYRMAGLLSLAAYAMAGLDSLGHYVLAPFSAHSAAMNSTILAEIVAAALVLAEVARLMLSRMRARWQ